MRYNDLPMNGEALRAQIYACGYNMSTFAKAMDVTPSAVHKWVRTGYPTGRHLAKVLDLLHPELHVPGTDERLEAVEREITRLRAEVRDVTALLAQLVLQQTGVAADEPATPSATVRRRSRP